MVKMQRKFGAMTYSNKQDYIRNILEKYGAKRGFFLVYNKKNWIMGRRL